MRFQFKYPKSLTINLPQLLRGDQYIKNKNAKKIGERTKKYLAYS